MEVMNHSGASALRREGAIEKRTWQKFAFKSHKRLVDATVSSYKAGPKAPILSCQSVCYNRFQIVLVYL